MIIINQEEFIKKAQDVNCQILDVRSPEECAAGIVSNAKMINIMDPELFQSEIEKLDKTKSYLVYCRSGNRSGKACQIMDSLGFTSTYNLAGGMLAWEGSLSVLDS